MTPKTNNEKVKTGLAGLEIDGKPSNNTVAVIAMFLMAFMALIYFLPTATLGSIIMKGLSKIRLSG